MERSFIPFIPANLFAAGEEVMAYFASCKFLAKHGSDGTLVADGDAPFLADEAKERFGIICKEGEGGMIIPGVMPEDVKRIVGQEMPRLRYVDRIALHTRAKAEAEKHGLAVVPNSPIALIQHASWGGIAIYEGQKQIGQVVIEADIPRIVQMPNGIDDALEENWKAWILADLKAGHMPVIHTRPPFYDGRLIPLCSRLILNDRRVIGGVHYRMPQDWAYFPSGAIMRKDDYDALMRIRERRAS